MVVIIVVIVIIIVIIVTKLLLACTKLFYSWIAWTFLCGSGHTHVHVDYNKLINWLKLLFILY